MGDVQFAKTAEFWSRLESKTSQSRYFSGATEIKMPHVGMNAPSVLSVILV